ncbi:MAG: purine-binding chemotaxis protein CheW [Clostridia bacterium]|nr:purine-binding chemotaxis protein CheW [Clostridia bacterium]
MARDYRNTNEPEIEEDTLKDKYLTFTLGKEVYGIEIRYITEIIGIQQITEVPEVPAFVRGIINLRGRIVPVVDVRMKFGKPPVPYDDRTCIIVVELEDLVIGMIVDNVADVLDIPEESVVPPPEIRTGFQNRYIKGIGKVGEDVKLLLDIDRFLNEDETEALIAVE